MDIIPSHSAWPAAGGDDSEPAQAAIAKPKLNAIVAVDELGGAMIRVAACALALTLVGGALARAENAPLYQPQPAWVKPIPIPSDVKPSGAAGEMLLWSVQDRLAPDDDESFIEQAIRINAPEGLAQADKLTLTWNPLTDTLAIHRARILRGDRVIDLLADGRKFTVLRRETNLEAAMIDGQLTATLQPEGVQVGDVIDLAYTLTRREPALAGHSEGGGFVGHAGTVGRLYVRTLWPAGKPFHSWKTDDLPPLMPVTRDGWTEIAFDQRGAVSPEPPTGCSACWKRPTSRTGRRSPPPPTPSTPRRRPWRRVPF